MWLLKAFFARFRRRMCSYQQGLQWNYGEDFMAESELTASGNLSIKAAAQTYQYIIQQQKQAPEWQLYWARAYVAAANRAIVTTWKTVRHCSLDVCILS
ncbi:hypothetical protein LGH70_22755 [Hymenobacter sp. BT635]|uniref:Uncharacterized protein n=1 Tax=Hymenobacter nitidus TaxID=2880929 RepID=A0ABS8AJI6_9BACT|nr:hypothetical protein [Hymenobacter nitidus]MCB2380431.1 hypothetical protein [Hymenobacter nitidus]